MSATSALISQCTDEQIAQLRENFRRIDLNHDGFVDKSEVVVELRKAFFGADDELIDAAAQQIIKRADQDGDQRIDIAEFLAAFEDPESPLQGFLTTGRPSKVRSAALARTMVSHLSQGQLDELRAAFSAADINHDGFLDPSEVTAALKHSFYGAEEEVIEDAAAYVVDTADRNDDGRIDMSEFFDFFRRANDSDADLAALTAALPQGRVASPPPTQCPGVISHLTQSHVEALEKAYHNRAPGMSCPAVVDSTQLAQVFSHLFPGLDADVLSGILAVVEDVAEYAKDAALRDIRDVLQRFPPGNSDDLTAIPSDTMLTIERPLQRAGSKLPAPMEFGTLAAQLPPSDLEKLKVDFHRIDLDGDGFVDEGELHHLLRGAFEEPDDALVERLAGIIIDVADRDGDGRISMKEFAIAFGPGGSLARNPELKGLTHTSSAQWDSDLSTIAVVRPKASHGQSPQASDRDLTSSVARASRGRQPLSDDLIVELMPFFQQHEASQFRTAVSPEDIKAMLHRVFRGAPSAPLQAACELLEQHLARTGRGHFAIGGFFEEMSDMGSSERLVVSESSAAVVASDPSVEPEVLVVNSDPQPDDAVQVAAESIEMALSRDERDLLRDVFISIDTDGDGLVDKDQVFRAATDVLGNERFREIQQALDTEYNAADFDRDGRLNLLEFTASFARGAGVLPQDVLLSSVADVRVRLNDDEICTLVENFHSVDVDSDGFLDPDELFAGLRDVFASGFDDAKYDAIVQAVLRAADRDGDGRLSVSEFIRSFQEDQGVLPPTFAQSRIDMMKSLLGPDVLDIVVHHVRDLTRVLKGPADFTKTQGLLRQRLSGSMRAAAPANATAMTEQVVRWLLSTAERDGAGQVSLQPFLDSYDAQQRLLTERPEEDRKLEASQSDATSAAARKPEETPEADVRRPRLRKVFQALDEDCDGFLLSQDMVPLIENLLRSAHPEWPADAIASAARSVFTMADADRDTKLSLHEFVSSFEHGYGVLPDDFVERVARKVIVKLEDTDVDRILKAIASVDDESVAKKWSRRDITAATKSAVSAVLPGSESATVSAIVEIVGAKIVEDSNGQASVSEFVRQSIMEPNAALALPLDSQRERVIRGLLRPPRSRASSFRSDAGHPGKSLFEIAFEVLDVNQSRFLERTEIEPLVFNAIATEHPEWGPNAVSNAAAAAVTSADTDGDGRLSLDEWTASLENERPLIPPEQAERIAAESSRSGVSTPTPAKIAPKEAHNLTYVFSRFDTNNDGFLDMDELLNGLTPVLRHRNPTWTSDQVTVTTQMFMNAADRDRDGRLALGEFIGSFSNGDSVLSLEIVTHAVLFHTSDESSQLNPVEIDQLRSAFNDIDVNKDGSISAVELEQLLTETNFPLPPETTISGIVQSVINFADVDNSGEISFEQFIKAFESDRNIMRVAVLAARERITRAESALANILADEELRKIARVFMELDSDKNGVLDFNELHDEMYSMMAAMHPEWEAGTIENAVRAVFDAADVNHDGMLTLADFISTFATKHYVLPPNWLEERSNRLTRHLTSEEIEELKEVFHAIDVNNDGFLSTRELETLMRETLEGTMRGDTASINAIVGAVLHVVDKNNDGCVSFTEFVEAYQQDTTVLDIPIMAAAARRDVAERRLEVMLCQKDMRDLAKVFLHLDRNGDGFISSDLLKEAMTHELRKSHPEWSNEKLNESVVSLLNSADINHDGRLSLDEFIATFVAGHYVLPPTYIKDVAAQMSRKLSDEEVRMIENIFKHIDTEKSGFVTPNQLRASLLEAVDEQTAEAICNAIMLVADENNDGILSMAEFVHCYELDNNLLTVPISSISNETASRIASKVVPKTKLRQYGILFNAVDTNNDGMLDQAELVAAVHAMVSPNADLEGVEALVRAKFLQADMDDDDFLNLDEFVASFTNPHTVFFPDDVVSGVADEVRAAGSRGHSPAATPTPPKSPSRVTPPVDASATKDPDDVEAPSPAVVASDDAAPEPQTAARPTEPPVADDTPVKAQSDQATPAQSEVAAPVDATPSAKVEVPSDKVDVPSATATPAARLNPTPPAKLAPGEGRTGRGQRSPLRNVGHVAVFDEELRDLFDKYDSNRNGFLDVNEFKQAYAALENFGLPLSDRELQRLFAPYAPGGKLTYDAFCILMLKRSRM